LSSINQTIDEVTEYMQSFENLIRFLRKIRETAPLIVSLSLQKGIEKKHIEEYLENIYYAMYAFQVLVYQDTTLGTIIKSTDIDIEAKLMHIEVFLKLTFSEKIFRIGVKNYYNQGHNNPQAHLGRIYWEVIDPQGNSMVCKMQIRGDVTGSHEMVLDMGGMNEEYSGIQYQYPLKLESEEYHFPLGKRIYHAPSLRLENEEIANLLRNYIFYSQFKK